MKDFAGKVVVVTGGAGGIGRALIEKFTDEGMKAVLADVVPDAVERTTAELRAQGRDVLGVVMGPLPRLATLAQVGADVALKKTVDWSVALPVIGGCTAFGLFFVVVACIVVNVKDY